MSPRWFDAAKVRTRQSALTARQASGSGCLAQASEPCNVAASRSAQPSMEDPKIWEGQETLPSVESVHCACVPVCLCLGQVGLNINWDVARSWLGWSSHSCGLVVSIVVRRANSSRGRHPRAFWPRC